MEIRDARAGDVPGITPIYNDAVENTTAIWNEQIVDDANRLAWLTQRQDAGFPVLVAVEDSSDGSVVGYATYGPWRPHDGYRHTVEHSVYVRSDQRGKGTGQALMRALIDRARSEGFHVMVAAIDAANEGSIRIHERLGFTRVGLLPQVGTKFGSWLDLALLQLTLDGHALDGPALDDGAARDARG